MSTAAAIESVPFAEAKDNLSRFVSVVVRQHLPRILDRQGEEPLLALPVADMGRALSRLQFDARVTFGDSVVVTLPQFSLVASGADLDQAIDALTAELTEYATDFFSDFDYYRHTERVTQFPWLLRFGLTPAPERRLLLLGDSGTPVDDEALTATTH